MSTKTDPVLIIGGSGIVGSQAARALRRLHPDLPIAIGGRDLAKAQAVAAETGGAAGVRVDLNRPDLGQPDGAAHSAVAMFLKDDTLNSMRYAQDRGLPYVGISSGTFEIGPEVALFVHRPTSAPILMASQWLAGAATLPTLHLAGAYETIEVIRISALLDEEDMGGPAAYADYERITGGAPAALRLQDGRFAWVAGDEAASRLRSVDGTEVAAQAYSPLDIVSLAAATDARSIRFDLAVAESASRRRGEPFSTEIAIEIEGRRRDGGTRRIRQEIVHPAGQAPLTALGVALGLERLLGLAGGPPVAPGLYLPEVLMIDPAYFVRRMAEFGARFETR
jgi:hypothetical protein